jgi:hypothetical protein
MRSETFGSNVQILAYSLVPYFPSVSIRNRFKPIPTISQIPRPASGFRARRGASEFAPELGEYPAEVSRKAKMEPE